MSRKAWPLDGMTFETLKERHAKRKPEDLEIDYGIIDISMLLRNVLFFLSNSHLLH